MAKNFTLDFVAGIADEGKMLREFLKQMEISKTALTDIKYKGGVISVNGKEVTVRYKLKADDRVKIKFPPEIPSEGMKGEKIPLAILYEDEYVLVVNKPSGMNTIPSREHPVGSLANGLIGYYENNDISATTHIVTRLDRDTSGLVLIAKHSHVHHLLGKQQRSGGVHRSYEAFAEGIVEQDEGIIEAPIARKPDSIIERQVHADGQYACTMFKVAGRYGTFTHLHLQLKTGRTHQIRVHMSFIGHPLLGDTLYGGQKKTVTRQALHCRELFFTHPFFDKEMHFTASLPNDMQEVLEKKIYRKERR